MKKDKWILGWKVVKKQEENNSVFTSSTTQGYVCFYSYTKITEKPKNCGPLAVFKSFYDAENFLKYIYIYLDKNLSIFEILPCIYIESKEDCVYSMNLKTKTTQKFLKQNLPYGTVLADKVLLVHIIKKNVTKRLEEE
jgi:hypothetical protein